MRDRRAERRARTCVGCGKSAPLSTVRSASARIERLATGEAEGEVLVRLIASPDGEITVDAGDGRFGRGAHVHPTPSCLERGARGLARSLRREPLVQGAPPSPASLAQLVGDAFKRRVEGLLVAARRSRKIAVGSDATVGSLRSGRGRLVVIAGDAAAAAKLGEVRYAIEHGTAVSFGDKASLAALVRPAAARPGSMTEAEGVEAPLVAVLAIEDVRLAAALREAVHVLDAVRGVAAGETSPQGRRRGAKPRGGETTGEGLRTGSGDAQASARGAKERNFDDGAAVRRASESPDAEGQGPDGRTKGRRSTSTRSAEAPVVSGSASREVELSSPVDEPEGVPGTGPGTGVVERGA